jgi:hypothetical protein
MFGSYMLQWTMEYCTIKGDGNVLPPSPHNDKEDAITRKAELLLIPHINSVQSWCREGTSENLNPGVVDRVYDSLGFGVICKLALSHLVPKTTTQNLCDN